MSVPLAESLRPKDFSQIVGQEPLLGPAGLIQSIVKTGKPLSIILWGPPGCGKTSLARLYARAFNRRFETLSAIFSGIADLKKILKEMDQTPLFGQSTLLFVDEIHRFNKAQQDAFLPFLENGTLLLVGATAENPSFYLNDALLSRVRVLKLHALDHEALEKILQNYEKNYKPLPLELKARHYLLELAHGDGRYLLNLVENLQTLSSDQPLKQEEIEGILQRRASLSDKSGDQHYNLISALHKSIRGSDPDATLYWLMRILEGGEEPLFIARRLIRIASEDIGLADPTALSLTLAARSAYETLGSPEGELALAQAAIYLALAPKSVAVYEGFKKAKEIAKNSSHLSPPLPILNAPTLLMKQMGYGSGYEYDPHLALGFSGQNYFPEGMKRESFYQPIERGFEREMKKRLDYFNKLRKHIQ